MPTNEKHVEPMEIEVRKKKKGKSLSCKKFGQVFYDKKEGTFCGRTPKDWGFLFVFLVLFYAILAGYFTLLFTIFTKGIMNDKIPFRQGANALNGPAPGFSNRPLMDNKSNKMIVSSNPNNPIYQNYQQQFDIYIKDYLSSSKQYEDCQAKGLNSNTNVTCSFYVSQLGPCQNGSSQLATGGGVCIYWHINNLYGWLPNISISSGSSDGLIYCNGLNLVDTQYLGPIQYHPSQNVSGITYGLIQNMYFPFLNQPGYLSPIVAVFLPNMTRNTPVNLVCNLVNVKNMANNYIMLTVTYLNM